MPVGRGGDQSRPACSRSRRTQCSVPAQENGYGGGFSVTHLGRRTARHSPLQTYNGHLGIIGGISILGTSGIVEPMSEKGARGHDPIWSWTACTPQGQRVAFLCPGNYGADFARRNART